MKYQIETFSSGEASLRDLSVEETMHSHIGPWAEAHAIYLDQGQVAQRLSLKNREPLVIYDVGLGIAANALASIRLFRNSPVTRDLHIVSYENQIDGLKYALEHSLHFPFLNPDLKILEQLLQDETFEQTLHSGRKLKWDLFLGDFRETIVDAEEPEVIYYDLFSPKTCPDLWGKRCFDILFRASKGRQEAGLDTVLCTYSSSTAVRSAMLLAGFNVGYGVSTQGKKETTVASTNLQNLSRPLDQKWLNHWRRSSKPLPSDYSENDQMTAFQKISMKLS
jgi:queuine tRNA-ribosyltransferase